MRLPEWAVDRVRVPVPRWVVGLFDPAQAYMERSRQRPPGSRRRGLPGRGMASYAPLTSLGVDPRKSEKWVAPAPPPEVPERKRRQVDERAVRREEVLASLGSFLDDAVKDLQERGTTVIAVPDAMLSARVVRFRWGDSVLEIDGRRGSGAGFEHRARLGRQDAKKQAEILKRYLTDGLADLAADS